MVNFRLLSADEIDCRIGTINEYGVGLLLYGDARVFMDMLDEKFGSMNWKKTYSRDNKNCLVEVWDEDKRTWVGKEDTGVESNMEKEKGLASDSFKRACVSWGIGRELYTAPDMFVKKERLQGFVSDGNKQKCNDKFTVLNISYDEKRRIKSVTIGITRYGKQYDKVTFTNDPGTVIAGNVTQQPVRQAVPAQKPAAPAPTKGQPVQPAAQQTKPVQGQPTGNAPLFSDDEQILIGGCSGYTYGQAKNMPAFPSFLKWVSNNPGRKYDDARKNDQFQRFLKLAAS